MRTSILIICAMLSAQVHADEDAKTERCVQVAGAFVTAANIRDTNGSPQEALQYTEQFPNVSLADRKKIVNRVYFDPSFLFVDYSSMQQQVFMVCMGAVKPYTPLK